MNWQTADLTALAGAMNAAGAPVGYHAIDHARVVYAAVDSHVHELYLGSGSAWHDADLTALAGGVDNVGNPSGYYAIDHARVVYAAVDSHVHELYLGSGSAWHDADLTALAGGVDNRGNPFGYEPFGHARVVHPGADGHVHELFLGPGSAWHDADLTALASAPPAADAPTAYAAYRHGGPPVARVPYRGPDDHVHELSLSAEPGSGWGHADLTALTGAPASPAAPRGYHAVNHARVIYRGGDDHIHELFLGSGPGSAWQHADLTALTGGRPAAGRPFGYSTRWSTGHHARVVYRGTDDHVHELFLSAQPGSAWGHADLTALTGSRPAAGDPTAYLSYHGRPTARVVYLDTVGHINELSLQGSEPLR